MSNSRIMLTCRHCGTKNPHGPADTDIISRRVPEE